MKKVLIVEDNALNRKLFKDILDANGFETLEATDGSEAITITTTESPDLIIMDMQLPEICGQEAAQWIKANPELRHIPIIAVTAFAMRGDEARFLNSGVDAYLPKPISIETFLRTIDQTMLISETPARMAS